MGYRWFVKRTCRRTALFIIACIVISAVGGRVGAGDSPAQQTKHHPDVTLHRAPKPLPPGARTGDWPCFLGPSHDGVSRETKLLKNWPTGGPTLVWEMKRGEGYAAPSIAGDRLVYLHRVGDVERIECLHAESGERYWSRDYPTSYRDRYGFNNGPRASPVLDGDRCYVHGVEGRLLCLDLQTGEEIWQHNTSRMFDVPANFFGVGSTPLVDGGLLIVQVGAPAGPCVVAFDKRDGTLAWKAGNEWAASYASPVPAVVHGKRRILVFAGGDSRPPTGGLMAIDPSDGRVDFRYPFRSRTYESVNASSPVIAGDLVLISSSYQTGAALLKLSSESGCEKVWQTDDFGAHFATPICKDGFLYGVTGMNASDLALACLDLENRRLAWRHVPEWEESVERDGAAQTMSFSTGLASLLAIDGQYLLLGDDGHLLWVDLSPKGYRELARARLFRAPETWTAPVVSRGLLYICQNRPDSSSGAGPRLLCYDLRGDK